ncbi:MAG: hypothetical protein V7767_14760 [Leeuwenhoekiella sp.]
MKITVISPFTFGYIDALVEELRAKSHVKVTFIRVDKFKFSYRSPVQRLFNFFLKTFSTRSLKKEYAAKMILDQMQNNEKQDFILVIRPDKLDENLLFQLKNHTNKLITYYFDSITNFPKKSNLIKYFDKVYSYEKGDVAKFNLEFITNFIPKDSVAISSNQEGLFNISSYDDRFKTLEKIAKQVKSYNYPCKFIVRSEKKVTSDYIKIISEYITVEESKKYLEEAAILLDVQKDDQEGLSFRVFEALQFGKKLITTNKDIYSYDFYNPNNILIINKENPQIEEQFLNTPYEEIPESIKSKYRRKAWLQKVFDV